MIVQREWADNSVSNTLYFKPKWKLVCFRDTYVTNPVHADDLRKAQYVIELREIAEKLTDSRLMLAFQSMIPIDMLIDGKFKIKTKVNKYGEWELYVYQYDPNHEENDIEKVLSAIVPSIKACSLLPHSAKGAYRQMPEEMLSESEYVQRLNALKPIDWSLFGGSDGVDDKFCSAESCEILK